jgi:hypothetical protein
MYMNDQNRQNYGTVGPGSKLFNIAIFLALFGACLTLVSGFSVAGLVAPQTQPTPGTCYIGGACDSFNNIDVTETTNSYKGAATLNVGSVALWLVDNGLKLAVGMITILAGALFFPLIMYSTMNGLFPGIAASPAYIAVLGILQITVLLIYMISMYEFVTKSPAGGTL